MTCCRCHRNIARMRHKPGRSVTVWREGEVCWHCCTPEEAEQLGKWPGLIGWETDPVARRIIALHLRHTRAMDESRHCPHIEREKAAFRRWQEAEKLTGLDWRMLNRLSNVGHSKEHMHNRKMREALSGSVR